MRHMKNTKRFILARFRELLNLKVQQPQSESSVSIAVELVLVVIEFLMLIDGVVVV